MNTRRSLIKHWNTNWKFLLLIAFIHTHEEEEDEEEEEKEVILYKWLVIN